MACQHIFPMVRPGETPLDALAAVSAAIQGQRPWSEALEGLMATVAADGLQLSLRRRGSTAPLWREVANRPSLSPDYALAWDTVNAGYGHWRCETVPTVSLVRHVVPDFGRHVLGTRLAVCNDVELRVVFVRSPARAPFQRYEQGVAEQLSRHYPLLFGVLAERLRARQADSLAQAMLERLAVPCAVVRTDLSVCFMTDSARDWLAGHAAYVRGGERLVLVSQACQAHLAASIQSAAAGRVVLAEDDDGRPTVQLLFLPFHASGLEQVRIVCFLNSHTGLAADPLLCAQAFGLTPAETRIAQGLSAGESLDDIANSHGVSANTVRTQLRPLLAKVGVRRLVDLVRLLGALPFGRVDCSSTEAKPRIPRQSARLY